MPTRERARPHAPQQTSLAEGARLIGYAPESLRKYMWTDDPPPLTKHPRSGRWQVDDLDALKAWAARRA